MSNNLGATQVTANQNQKEATLNDQIGRVDAALTELTALSVTSSNALTVTATQFTSNFTLQFDDDASTPTALVTITVPGTKRGGLLIFNNMTQPLEIGISGQGGTKPVVDVGEKRLLRSDGVNVQEMRSASPDFRGALVNINATQSISNATATAVGWDAEAYDHAAGRNQFWLGANATVTAATDDNVTLTAHAMETGDGPFQFTTSDTLPAGLSVVTDYWAVKTGANTFKVATSLANAKAATVVDVTDTGTGTHTLDRETRLVVPDGVSRVRLAAAVEFAGNATGERLVEVLKNGAAVLGGGAQSQQGNANNNFMALASSVLEVTAGDQFELQVTQNSTGALNLLSANSRTWFAVEELR